MTRPEPPRRIVLTGPESTGKTTLCERLARRFDTVWVPEFARGYLDLVNAARAPGGPICEEDDLVPILAGQLALEEALAGQARGVLVCDTDPLTTLVYAEHYFGRCPAAVRRAVESRRYELTLLLDVDVPWVPDPQRDRPLARRELHSHFRAALERFGRRYRAVGGDWKERFSASTRAIEEELAGSNSLDV